ncbi:hypothetical protein VpaJT1_62 [Vibrio phage VpaJT_1]|nr:hypothetical protein VpaJT1_62 [Vibrio phage VpaJT_1]
MAVPTTVQMVRDLLIGADATTFDDAYIQRAIDGGMNAIDIAIMIAESSASLYATKQDLKVGPISLSNSQKAKAWMGIKKNLIMRKQTGSGLPNDGSATSGGLAGLATGTLTGASVQAMNARADDPDRTPNQFEIGQFDNPPTSPSGADKYDSER